MSADWWSFPCVELVRVVDGDTVWVEVVLDCGFRVRITHQVKIRLDGINAPEMNTSEDKAAKAFIEDWFARHQVDGIVLYTRKHPEKYGRWLGRFESAGRVLNDELVAAGLANPYTGKRAA